MRVSARSSVVALAAALWSCKNGSPGQDGSADRASAPEVSSGGAGGGTGGRGDAAGGTADAGSDAGGGAGGRGGFKSTDGCGGTGKCPTTSPANGDACVNTAACCNYQAGAAVLGCLCAGGKWSCRPDQTCGCP